MKTRIHFAQLPKLIIIRFVKYITQLFSVELCDFTFIIKTYLLGNVGKNQSHCSNMCITNVKQSIKIDFSQSSFFYRMATNRT